MNFVCPKGRLYESPIACESEYEELPTFGDPAEEEESDEEEDEA